METLEDAAKNKYPIENTGAMFMPNRHEVTNIYKQEAFIDGAKWQAERMYYEEEVVDLIADWTKMAKGLNMNFPADKFEQWFEQFKKK